MMEPKRPFLPRRGARPVAWMEVKTGAELSRAELAEVRVAIELARILASLVEDELLRQGRDTRRVRRAIAALRRVKRKLEPRVIRRPA